MCLFATVIRLHSTFKKLAPNFWPRNSWLNGAFFWNWVIDHFINFDANPSFCKYCISMIWPWPSYFYTWHYDWIIIPQKCRGIDSNWFQIRWIISTHGNWKNQNPGSPFWTALPIWPIWPNYEVNGLDWQCCLAGSSKRAPRIFIFSIFLGAEYSSYVKFIAIYGPTFFGYIISVLVIVS